MKCDDVQKRIAEKAVHRRIVKRKLLELANDDGLVSDCSEELFRIGRKLGVLKCFHHKEGKLGPNGHVGWYFVRLTDEKNYFPPNYEKYNLTLAVEKAK